MMKHFSLRCFYRYHKKCMFNDEYFQLVCGAGGEARRQNAENRDDLWIISAYNGGWYHKVIINSFLAYNKLHRV